MQHIQFGIFQGEAIVIVWLVNNREGVGLMANAIHSLNYDDNYDVIIVAMELQKAKKELFVDYDEEIAMVNFVTNLFHTEDRFKHFIYVSQFAREFWRMFYKNPKAIRKHIESVEHDLTAKDEFIFKLLNETVNTLV